MKALLVVATVFAVISVAQGICNRNEACKSIAQCGGRFHKGETPRTCELENRLTGFCCEEIDGSSSPRRQSQARPAASSPQIFPKPSSVSSQDISNKIDDEQSRTPAQEIRADGSEEIGLGIFNKHRKSDQDLRDAATILLHLGEDLLSIRNGEDEDGFVLNADNSAEIDKICPWKNQRRPRCTPIDDIFRTVDGSCNNPIVPIWGMSGTPLQRILPSAYNLKNLPRVAQSGRQLPSARLVTQNVFVRGVPRDTNGISTMFMQMGQFIDHDLTHSPTTPTRCCNLDSQGRPWIFPNDPFNNNPDFCFPIEIPANDEFWGPPGRRCYQIIRSDATPPLDCRAGVREQMTTLTHWLDASNVYGSTKEESDQVRDPKDRYLLRISKQRGGNRPLLPQCAAPGVGRNFRELEDIEACENELCENPRAGCFFAGDLRANEQPGLTVIHTVWVREHNRVARELRQFSDEDDETVFQKARRIVIGEWQHIIYNEWLPILLGSNYMTTFGLFPRTNGYNTDYNRNLDARVNNEFAAAAFRFGHTMIPTTHPAREANGRSITPILDFRTVFDEPSLVRDNPNFVDATVRGQTQDSAPAHDSAFTDDITNHLFEENEDNFGGLDLPAINIQRAREHGIPGYNRYRSVCKYGAATSFSDLKSKSLRDGYLTADDIRRLEAVYDDVEDIDLFVGGTIESPDDDSILGPAFKCIIGDQFQRAKKGDRFFYENIDNGFTPSQLQEIRKASMARIFCDNTDITEMQPRAFKVVDPNEFNELIPCNDGISIPRLDLSQF